MAENESDFIILNNFQDDGLPTKVSLKALSALANSSRASPVDVNINNTILKNTQKQEGKYVNKQC